MPFMRNTARRPNIDGVRYRDAEFRRQDRQGSWAKSRLGSRDDRGPCRRGVALLRSCAWLLYAACDVGVTGQARELGIKKVNASRLEFSEPRRTHSETNEG